MAEIPKIGRTNPQDINLQIKYIRFYQHSNYFNIRLSLVSLMTIVFETIYNI